MPIRPRACADACDGSVVRRHNVGFARRMRARRASPVCRPTGVYHRLASPALPIARLARLVVSAWACMYLAAAPIRMAPDRRAEHRGVWVCRAVHARACEHAAWRERDGCCIRRRDTEGRYNPHIHTHTHHTHPHPHVCICLCIFRCNRSAQGCGGSILDILSSWMASDDDSRAIAISKVRVPLHWRPPHPCRTSASSPTACASAWRS